MPSLSTPTRVMGMQNFPTLVRTGAARFADSTAKFEVGSVTKMGRRLIGKQAMTGAERQARYRARQRQAWLASLCPEDRTFYERFGFLLASEDGVRDISERTNTSDRSLDD